MIKIVPVNLDNLNLSSMKWTSTLPENFKRSAAILVSILFITFINTKSYSQTRTYADLVTVGTAAADHVDDAGNAILTDNTFARVKSSTGSLLGGGKFVGTLELKFPSPVSAGKTAYIRINSSTSDLLNTLLGGSIGKLVADLGNQLLLGNHTFEVGAKMGASTILSGNSSTGFPNTNIKIIKDAAGFFYIAITPNAEYDRIYIKDKSDVIIPLLTSTGYTDVYYAFTTTDVDECSQAFATSYDAAGLNLDLLGLGKAGVTNMENAIDANQNNFSQLSLGIISVVGSISQDLYFGNPSSATDDYNVKIKVDPALLNLGLLNNISVTAYNGLNQVGTSQNLSSLISLDLLGLLNNGDIVSIPVSPGGAFDHVRITVTSLLNVSLPQSINLYSITRSAGRPVPTLATVNACSGTAASLSATTGSANELKWYDSLVGGNLLATTAYNQAYTPTVTENKIYYVAAKKINCTQESARVPVSVVVTAMPDAPSVASVAPICAGKTAVLSVSAPVAGTIYKWYDVAGGGTELGTGTTYTTSVLNASKTFYVEAVTGTCTSLSRTPVLVTVNSLPALASITTNNETISAGQTATLKATAEAGATINWYAASTGGASLGNGGTFTTPALSITTTYYVETTNASGCASATRVPVVVTVIGAPVNPNCNAAIAQQSGIDGLCLLCGVTDPGNSTDSNPNNFTKITLSVGVGATGYQRLIFGSAGAATDSIRLDLETPVGLADLSLLSAITVKVFNGTDEVASYPLNDALLDLRLLSGNRFKATLPAGGVYDRVEIRFGALVAALSSLNIYGAQIIYPNPTVAATGQSICSGSSTTLSATANGGTTLKWYAASSGGSSLGTGESFTTGALTTTTTYYIEVSKGSCANVQRVPVTVTVNPVIVFASTTLSNATVAAAYSKQITLATGGTPGFTYALEPGSTLPTGLTLSPSGTIAGTPTASGTFNFSIIATDSKGCTATAAYTLVSTPAMALPSALLPKGVVGTVYPEQTLPAAIGGTTPYTYSTTGGLPPGLNFDPATRKITGTPTQKGTFVFPVKATDANGNSITTNYTIVVKDPLVLATAPLADGIVGTVYPSQTIPSATGGSESYTYSATGVPSGLNFDPLTRQITGTPAPGTAGTYTIPVKVTDSDGSSVTTNYTLKVSDPLVLAGKVLADGTVGTLYVTETLPSATGGSGVYTYVASNVPPGLNFDPLTRQISGTPTQSGTFNISVKVTDNAGANVTQVYALKVNGVLSLPAATLASGLVGTVYPAQSLPVVSGGTAPYTYTVTGLPNGITYNAGTHQLVGTPTIGGTFTVTLKATDNGGLTTSTDYALVVNVPAPLAASKTICSGTATTLTVSNAISGVSYRWYASSGGSSIFTGTTYTTGTLSSNTTYYVEAVSGTAVSSRTAVTVSLNALPALASITTNNETISAGQTATLKATAEAGATINWYAASTGGASLGNGGTFTTPALSITTTYYVETTNASGCASATRAPVTVTVTSIPVNSNCNVAVAQQSGVDGLCLLCGITDPGNSTDSNPNNFTKITLSVGVGATGYQRLIFGSQGSTTDSIRLDLETPVGLADLSLLSAITVKVFNGITEVASYPLNSALLDLRLLSGNRFKATLPAGGVYDRVEIRFGALVAALSSLNIYGAQIIYPNPTVDTIGQSICSGSSTTLSATANGGTSLKWYAASSGGTALGIGESFITGALTTTTTYYIEVSKGSCANVQRVPVTVTVTSTPVNPAVAAVAPICSGSTAVLTVSTPVVGVVYSWYADNTGGTALGTGTSFTTTALTVNKTYYVQAATGTCVSVSRTGVTVVVNALPAPAIVTTNNETVSAGQTATLAATADAGLTINWYGGTTGGTILKTGPTFTTPILNTTVTYYVETVNASGCSNATRVPVTVTVTGGPVNPNCNAANAQQSGIEGICVLCRVLDAGNSVDDNLTNYSTISLPLGVIGSGYQTMIFSGPGTATDSIRLNLETPTGLADVTVLGGIQIKIMNGTTVVSTHTLSASLLNLRLLSGNRFIATLPAGGVYDRVEVRVSGLLSALMNLRIYGAEVIYPNPTVATTGQNICSGNATTLSATANGGTTLRWYSAATGGTLLQTGGSYTTPVLTATTTYYIEVSKGTCANIQRIPVTVTVTTAPATVVVAAVPPICAGSTVSIPVSNPIAGTTYNWYTTANAGTPIFSGPVFTSPVLNAGTIYYVEAANGNCVTATRTAVSVTVNPLPVLPQIQASATTVNPGQTAVLTASSTDTDVIFNWYTSATAITPVYTGPTYVTPPLTVTTTYYLSATSSTTGCSSASRVQVTINVSGGNPNPVPCEAPTLQENGVDGIALLAGVFNQALAIDDNTTTGSSLVMPVGLLGASVYQRVIFTNLSNIGDTVRVSLSAPGKLLSLGLLSNIKVGTYNGNTNNNDGLSLNDPLLRVELLSGNTEALVSFVPTKTFNKIEVRVNSGVLGALTTVDLNYAQRVVVAPEVVSADVKTCEGLTATLEVKNPKAGITYKWYNAAGTYLSGKDGTTFTTPVLSASTRYFVEANSQSNCTSYRTPVNVTVTPTPLTPVLVSSTINTCAGSDVLLEVSNPLIGITYKWYNNAGVYQAGKDGVTFEVLNVTGTTTYSVEAVNSCNIASASKAIATINIGNIDPPIVTPTALTVRSGTPAVLTATSSSANAVFKWYDSPGSLVVLHTGSQYTTDPLLNAGPGIITKTFYVTAEIAGGCPASARASVVVTIIPNGIPADVPCEAATITVRSGVDGVVLLGGVFNPGKAVDNDTESASSLVMPVGVLGASVYQQVAFTGLSNVGDTVRVRISSPGKLLSLAVLPSIELTTFNGNTSNNDMIVASNPLLHLELLSDNSGAILTFVPQKQFNGVELRLRSGLAAVLSTLDFNYAQRIIMAPTVQSAVASVCAGSSATLAVTNPAPGIVYKWYRGSTHLSDGPTLTTDPALAAGTYNYFVSATRNACESAKTKVVVTILPAPLPPVAATGNPASTCPNVSVNLNVNPVTGVSFNWYDALVGGNLLAANTTTYATPANLGIGTHIFYVEAVNGNSCISTAARTKITLIVNPNAIASDVNVAGAGAPFCAGTKATLTATSTTVTAPVFTWYSDPALTTVAFTGPVFETPVLTVTRTYYVTVRGTNKCENTAATAKVVTLTVNPPAVAADINVAGAAAPFCAGTAAILTATSTTVTSPVFTWYSDAALTTVAFTGPVFTTPGLTATRTYYVTVRGANKCENTAATAKPVVLTVNPPAIASDISVTGGDGPFCSGTAATLTATTTTVTSPVFTWYSDAALTTVAFTGPVFATPLLTATRTYYVTVRGTNKCENTVAAAKVVTLTVNPPAVAADINVAGASTPICAGTTATLTATSTTVNSPVFTWYSDANLTTVAFTGPVFATPVLTAARTYYVTVRGTNKCENTAATAKAVVLTVNPPAIATDINVAGAGAPFCAGTKATLTATSTTVTSPVFTWYSDANLTTVAFTGPVFETPVLTATRTYYVTVRGANKCENGVGTARVVTLTVNPPAVASDINVAGAGSPFCAGTTATLTATTTTVTSPVFTWYSDAALSTVAFTGPVFTTPVLTATRTYYVTVRGANKCENTTATAKAVTLTVNPPAVAADVNVAGADAPFCMGTKATLTATSTTVTSPVFTWYSDATLTTVAFTGPVFETPVLTATRTYYVTVRGANKCENTAATAKAVTLTVNPPAVAADVNVAGANAPFCAGNSAILTATSTTVTSPVFTWYSDPALTTVAFTGPVFTTPVLTGTVTYYVTVRGANRCENTIGTARVVTLTVNPPAIASDIAVSAAGPICAGNSVTLNASTTTVNNPVFTWYSDAVLTNAISTGASLNTGALTTTTTYYVTVRGTNKCPNTPATARIVTVTVNPLPVNPIVSTAGTNICSDETTILTIQNAEAGISYQWYAASTGGAPLFTGTQFTTGILNNTTEYYVVAVSTSGCGNTSGRIKTIVTVSPKPDVPNVVLSTVNVCIGKTGVLSVSNPQTGITYKWYTMPAGGTELATGSDFTTPVITANAIFYVEASTATCISTSRKAVNVNAVANPIPPASVAVATDPLCSGTSTVLSVNNPDASFTYRWYSSASGGVALADGNTFTAPALTATTTYYVEAVSKLTSCISTTRTSVTVTVLSKLDVPVVSTESVTATSITFKWNVVPGATAYEVSLDNGTTWLPPSTGTNGTTYLVSNLKPDQSVTIRVRAKGQLDCQLSDATTLTAKSDNPLGNNIFVPNTFTPNNDGKNDVLLVYANTIAKMKLRIYNQWGQFLYESVNIQNGWDGTYKGDIQPNGVYVYYLDAEFNDGTKTTKKGTVTLLR